MELEKLKQIIIQHKSELEEKYKIKVRHKTFGLFAGGPASRRHLKT
jgi:hypothetical protein